MPEGAACYQKPNTSRKRPDFILDQRPLWMVSAPDRSSRTTRRHEWRSLHTTACFPPGSERGRRRGSESKLSYSHVANAEVGATGTLEGPQEARGLW